MDRAVERYHQRRQQKEQGRDDGYDEDWDDDVYYAAASRPDSSGRATGRDIHVSGGSRQSEEKGRERATTKRHYMKVPNIRQLRAMRSTPTTADGFPLGAAGGPTHDLNNQGRLSSPRASVSTDPGDTLSSTTSLGDGSSAPPLGQLTPPSLPPQEESEGVDAGAAASAAATAQGVMSTRARAPGSSAAVASPSRREGDTNNNNNIHSSHPSKAVGRRERNESSLVLLRGSPRLSRDWPTSNRPSFGAEAAVSSAAAGQGQGQGRRTTSPGCQASPTAVLAGVAAGVAAGAAAVAASGNKRKRPPPAWAAWGAGQRFGDTAWPKLRRGEPPPLARNPDGGGVGEPADGLAERSRGGGRGGEKRDSSAISSWRRSSPSHEPSVAPNGGGGAGPVEHRNDNDIGSPGLCPGSSRKRPAGRQGQGDDEKGKGPAQRGGGGGDGSSISITTGAATKGPSLTDRPARWAAKSGGSSLWSRLRPPGSPSALRGGVGSMGNNNNNNNELSVSPPWPSTAASGSKRTVRSISLALSPSRRSGGLPRIGRGGEASPSRSRFEGQGEGPTFKLTSVFQATAAKSSSSRPRGAWGKNNRNPGGSWEGSQHPHVRGRQRASGNSSGEATPPSFDPTRIGARPAGVVQEEQEEVEEVGSDDYDDDDDFLETNAFDVTDWPSPEGGVVGGGGSGDGVADYEDQLLGEDGCKDTAAPSVESELQRRQQQSGAGLKEEGCSETPGAEAASVCEIKSAGVAPSANTGAGEAHPDSSGLGTPSGESSGAAAGTGTVAEGVTVPPTSVQHRRRVNDPPATATTAAVESSRGDKGRHQQQQMGEPNKDSSPPPRTPVRPPRTMLAASSSGRSGPSSSAAAVAASTSTTGGKWRPSFGSGSGGGARGGVQSPPGAMHAPWAAFSTPARDRDRDGSGMAPSGSMGMGAVGSASARRRRGSGAGSGPLGRLLQQVRTRCDGDEARLLSGEFPFRQVSITPIASRGNDDRNDAPGGVSGGGASGGKSRRDYGDPRTRCSVALDTTVVLPATPREVTAAAGFGAALWGSGKGNSYDQGGGGGGGASGLVRLSCMVHRVLDMSTSSSSSNSSSRLSPAATPSGANANVGLVDSEGCATSFERLRSLEGIRVDALFKQDTRRAVDVCPGSQLRIYDPCCVWYDAEVGGGGGEQEGARALLMCTQLCEPYPSCLPSLPPLSSRGGSSLDGDGACHGGGGEGYRPPDAPAD